jgi:hypothetical protein
MYIVYDVVGTYRIRCRMSSRKRTMSYISYDIVYFYYFAHIEISPILPLNPANVFKHVPEVMIAQLPGFAKGVLFKFAHLKRNELLKPGPYQCTLSSHQFIPRYQGSVIQRSASETTVRHTLWSLRKALKLGSGCRRSISNVSIMQLHCSSRI